MHDLNFNVLFNSLISFSRQFHIRGAQYENDLLPDADFKYNTFNKHSLQLETVN